MCVCFCFCPTVIGSLVKYTDAVLSVATSEDIKIQSFTSLNDKGSDIDFYAVRP